MLIRLFIMVITIVHVASAITTSAAAEPPPFDTGQGAQDAHEWEPRQNGGMPLIIQNSCGETIFPAILTQSGSGPGTGGFQLNAGSSRTLSVGRAWQGRVWGRTNCSFNGGGGNGPACVTGDCGSTLSCQGAGEGPVTLAEFTLDTGSGQSFYDMSLVDGYNLPVAIQMQSLGNSSFNAVPPNLTNPSCVGTASELAPQGFNPYSGGQTFLGTNSSDPLPFENRNTANQVSSWCPSNLEVNPLAGPSNGIYSYPDGNLQRPPFDPCLSSCAKFHQPQDCCTGRFGSPSACQPSPYSKAAKSVCPDAYSYAFDDQTSTFIIPAGAGFEVIFCPGGRSTNILAIEQQQLMQLQTQGHVKRDKITDFILDLVAPKLEEIPLAVASQMTDGAEAAYNERVNDDAHDNDDEVEMRRVAVGDRSTTRSAAMTEGAAAATAVPSSRDDDDDANNVDRDVGVDMLAPSERLSQWSQRHRWNGSGALVNANLERRRPLQAVRQSRASSSSSSSSSMGSRRWRRHGGFLWRERMHSIGLGMVLVVMGLAVVV